MSPANPVEFRWAREPLLCKPVISKILMAASSGSRSVTVSLDLGMTEEPCEVTSDRVVVRGSPIELDALSEVAENERGIYLVREGRLIPASIAGEHFYKLVLVRWGRPPTLEIDGIHMHRVKDVTPDTDAQMKISLLGDLRCRRVLDTCTGLGYTAIEAVRRGACHVTSFEVDANVLELARLNPWSRWLEDERIKIFNMDAAQAIEEYDEYFDAAIHDPPRISLAGELYSLEFYRKLSGALRRGGRIVHYVGQPGIRSGKKIWKGVMERMRMAGFDVKFDPASRCVYGYRRT